MPLRPGLKKVKIHLILGANVMFDKKLWKAVIYGAVNSKGRGVFGHMRYGLKMSGYLIRSALAGPLGVRMFNLYEVECLDSDGNLKWREIVPNLVVNAGLDDVLDKYFKGSAYTAAFYVGLKDTGSFAAGDTMASHAGWATITPYSDATDPALTLGTVSGQSVDNSASKASFSINATDAVYGAFLKDNNTKGGATGLLYGGADFAAVKNVVSGDTLNVTVTLTAASA